MADKKRRVRRPDMEDPQPEETTDIRGPEGYNYRFKPTADITVRARHPTSPWRPLLHEFVEQYEKTGHGAFEIDVSGKQDGRNLCNRLRDVFRQIMVERKKREKAAYRFATRVARETDKATGAIQWHSYFIITVELEDEKEEEDD